MVHKSWSTMHGPRCCDNFLRTFKGTPPARKDGPVPAEVACRDAEVSRGNCELERTETPGPVRGSRDALTPGRQPAAPYGRKPTGRGAAAGRHRPHPQAAGTRSNAPTVTAPARLTGSLSPRRAFCRRAKITVKGAPTGTSPAAMAQAPPLTLIFHGEVRRQSEGRAHLDLFHRGGKYPSQAGTMEV
jgi:hypothetical protein